MCWVLYIKNVRAEDRPSYVRDEEAPQLMGSLAISWQNKSKDILQVTWY